MQSAQSEWMAMFLLLFVAVTMETGGAVPTEKRLCFRPWSPCYLKVIRCPKECPYTKPKHPNAKACYLNCYSPKCEAVCHGEHGLFNRNFSKILTLERTGTRNSIRVMLEGIVEAMLNVVPVTKEDDEIHNYQIPSDDSFAHFEVQFRFIGLSPQVEGVLGRTYRPDYVNTAKRGVPMPVVGGEDKYKTSSLLSADCKLCLFSPKEDNEIELHILRWR
uniref:Uncharacterized protein LOC109505843 n=1 Tax=Elaeis guineensis var. tenera TaxID=51953 RepID=A0A8N4EZ21_ELAGV|nr:uncharacterized protein LOC109505843 [Elaeis guineensis]